MRSHSSLSRDEDANAAASAAGRGAIVGAARYAIPLFILSGAGQVLSPIYRGLTVQFKVFLVMSGMVLGGMIEGDRRLRDYEKEVRIRKRWERIAREEQVERAEQLSEERRK